MDPNRMSLFELRSAFESNIIIPPNMDGTPSKMNPLKTTKQRNTSNNHRKNQQRSSTTGGRNNSTDEDVRGGEHSHTSHPHPSLPLSAAVLRGDEEGFRKSEGDNENENTTNNDEQSGFVDSENDNIAERLCSLSKLSLHNSVVVAEEEKNLGHFSGVSALGGSHTGGSNTAGVSGRGGAVSQSTAFSPHSVPISKVRNPSYPTTSSFIESDSIGEAHLKNHFIPVQSSSGCPGATTGDGDTMDDSSGRRFRRRRRRRGHNTNTKKRIAVDTSVADTNEGGEEMTLSGYPIRHSERPGPSGVSHKKFNKLGRTIASSDPLLDAYGMKRKRTIGTGGSALLAGVPDVESDSKLGDMDLGDVGSLSLNSPEMIDDQEMRSEDEDEDGDCSSCDSVDEAGDEDDRGREADDEQSDWVFDEWSSSNPNKTKEESASSRKKRLLKMLRSYNDMISANVGGGGPSHSAYQIQTREIRAGKRRVFISKPGFPTKGIWTSANEEVSKFLQDPLQSQIRLQPISAEEGVQLSHLASLYSLRMDYCNTPGEEQKIEDIDIAPASLPEKDDGVDGDSANAKLIPVLTKTPNTTQMDKTSYDPLTVSSPFNANAEGSSSSNVSSVYGPTYSDVDSRTSDSKRIKK